MGCYNASQLPFAVMKQGEREESGSAQPDVHCDDEEPKFTKTFPQLRLRRIVVALYIDINLRPQFSVRLSVAFQRQTSVAQFPP